MPERVLKIVLPESRREHAMELLESQKGLVFWLEAAADTQFVASALIDSGQSEPLMDLFEKRFAHVEGFKLILFPVEASIPRIKAEEKVAVVVEAEKEKKKSSLRISREELYSDIVDSTKLSPTFILMAILSTIVVCIGLEKNNVAVIIGAMVIAPFLGPNVALALSTVLAEKKLGNDAMKTLLSGILIVLVISASMGFFYDINPRIPEIASRTQADFFDILLALASGSAGVLAFTTGASAVVIGVMVAVALLPPLAVTGLLLGSGEFSLAGGAFLLFSTNIICINLAGIATFLLQGVSPLKWWDADKAKKSTKKSLLIWTITLAMLVVIIWLWSRK